MNQIFCQNCGTANAVGARFCNACGGQISGQASAPPPPQYAPPQVYQQPPIQNVIYQQAPVYQKKKRGTLSKILGGLLTLVICCLAAGFAYYYVSLRPIQGAATDFLNAVQNQEYTSAYNMCTKDLQSAVGNSPQGLQSFVEGGGLMIQNWKFANVKRKSGDPPQGSLTTDATLQNSKQVKLLVALTVVKPDNIWKVMGFGIE
jgi:hypothetical protein